MIADSKVCAPNPVTQFIKKTVGGRTKRKRGADGSTSPPLHHGVSCLGVFPRGWPQAHNGPSVLHLLQVIEADVLAQLNHFIHPEDVCHPMV